MMNVFAHAGFDVWTMDHEGYGRSTQTTNNSDIASGVEDLKAAMAVVQRETGQSKVHMFGESSGAIRAGAFAQSEPDRVDRLISPPSRIRAAAPPKSSAARSASPSCAPIRGANATPP